MNSSVIEIKNLNISFGKEKSVVKDLSYQLAQGETLGVVGESGSGKSITSLSIMGLLHSSAKVNSGEIIFHEADKTPIDLLSLPSKVMRTYRGKKIAMVFQEPMTSLNPVIKCGEQVAEAIRLHEGKSKKEAREEVIKWFEEVLLPRPEDIYESYPHQLSGGQKQRVMIAMAMCCKPQLLIADEPTTALDVTVQKKILALIKNLQLKYKMSVIFITHDLGVVAEIADRVIVMKEGELVEEGSCSAVFSQAKHPYTKGLLACRPPLDYRLKRLPTVKDFLAVEQGETSLSEIEIKISPHERNDQLQKLFKNEKILEVKNLKTHFPIRKGIFRKVVGYVKAVDDVSFDAYKGETLGLVGESGCGKTTLGRSILNLIPPTGGEVIFEGNTINDLSSEALRRYRKELQIIFQDPYSSLNPRIQIGEAIVEPMRVHLLEGNEKKRKEKAIDLMETVGLKADQFNRYPHEFSGGQRQRICIARSLALSPKFIVCDESVSALDVSVQAQVLNLLNDLKIKFNFTYIFISHDLSVVKYMSDRMLVMRQGRIVESGIAEEVYGNPQSEYTQELISAIPQVNPKMV
ncbi:MAG: ABC transporter ATP-binding protein [Vicingaceae bacterium]